MSACTRSPDSPTSAAPTATRCSRTERLLVLAALVAAVALSASPARASAACPGSDVQPTVETLDQARAATLCVLNQVRAGHRLRALHANATLLAAAKAHSQEMVDHHYFSHNTLGGLAVIPRLRATGYAHPGRRYLFGEALGYNYDGAATPERIVAQLLRSPLHRGKLLGPGFVDVGIGIVPEAPFPVPGYPGATYTFDFGRR